MAAINVVLNGTFTSDAGSQVGTFIGTMAYSDRGVGGGPMPGGEHPAHPIAPGGERPAHPIAPGGRPPHPEHPIVLPDPPIDGPPIDPPTNPPDPNWEWGWNPNTGWVPVYTPGDKPQPPG